jgi:hypothetical protein
VRPRPTCCHWCPPSAVLAVRCSQPAELRCCACLLTTAAPLRLTCCLSWW